MAIQNKIELTDQQADVVRAYLEPVLAAEVLRKGWDDVCLNDERNGSAYAVELTKRLKVVYQTDMPHGAGAVTIKLHLLEE